MRVLSFVLDGIVALPVAVEVDVSNGVPQFDVVGLPDAAVRESRERVRAAIKNSGWDFPVGRITVNLAPAYTKKGGAGFDLAIALAILAATGHLPVEALERMAIVGELALDGALRPVRGVLAMALAARAEHSVTMLVPQENGAEAALAGTMVFGAGTLAATVGHLTGQAPLARAFPPAERPEEAQPAVDLADVKGQLVLRRALEVAAAGGHNLFMVGVPGAGKSLLARCLPGILPALGADESLEVSRIHSVAGLLQSGRLLKTRPFRAPHHTASASAILGGGNPLRPGEITLAHRGVLFLDELPEFRRDVLEGLRQPLEDGRILLSRAHGGALFPARPMLVAAANPCPCGYLGDPVRPCTCHNAAVTLYRARLSGPLLDRFDLQVFVEPVQYDQFATLPPGGAEPSGAVRERVSRARLRQTERLRASSATCNAEMSPRETARFCPLPSGGAALMREAIERLGLTLRGHDKVLKVARTIADLAGADEIEVLHLAEALQYRVMDRSLPAVGLR